MSRNQPIFASRDIAEWLGAYEVFVVPPEARADEVTRLWRQVDKQISAKTHLTVFAEGGAVLAWPRVPEPIEPIEPGGDHD